MGIDEILKDKRAEILQVAEEHGATDIRVFGSIARGEARADSDVDLLVTFEAGRSLLDHAALISQLAKLLGRKVEVASERGLKPRYRERILREAVPL